jgi:small subunit ribosomal protein S16
MVVRIRLARFGRKHRPFYRIVVADARSPRDGRHLERVGTYDPLPGKDGIKEVRLRADRIRYWMACGAQPTSKVAWLLGKAGILPEQPRPEPVVAPEPIAAPPAAEATPAAEAPAQQTRAFSSRRRLAPVVGAVGAFRSDIVLRRVVDDDLDNM